MIHPAQFNLNFGYRQAAIINSFFWCSVQN